MKQAYNGGMKDLLLLLHPTLGVLGILTAVWMFVEVLNARASNTARIKWAATATAIFMIGAWVTGGYWYVTYYAADKAIILASSWPVAHSFFMEVKEHSFFILLVLALLLPLIAKENDLAANRSARRLALWTCALVILSALAMEGMGSVIALGVRIGLMGSPQ